jgi:D-alanyl-D-alanine carboxypeptidase/D-alanyl-D-alanine-endopeptidase (penicillin-binding protein 4)
LYAGALFKESLRLAGITVSGDVVSGVVPDGIHEIARHVQPIQKVVETMNKQSDNLSAENILKVMGALKYSIPGSARNGVFLEDKFLSTLGMDTTMFSIADGSGVSRHNLLSADQLVQLLVALNKLPRLFMMFYNSLPIAGLDGTIANRMIQYPAAYNLHAKTGTLNGVSCLSGYVQTRDGEMLAFAIMMQNFVSSSSEYRQAQDRIGYLLAGFSRTMVPE